MEVLEVEVEELGDQVEEAVHNWSLSELSGPHGRLGSLNQQLKQQAALRWTPRCSISTPCHKLYFTF